MICDLRQSPVLGHCRSQSSRTAWRCSTFTLNSSSHPTLALFLFSQLVTGKLAVGDVLVCTRVRSTARTPYVWRFPPLIMALSPVSSCSSFRLGRPLLVVPVVLIVQFSCALVCTTRRPGAPKEVMFSTTVDSQIFATTVEGAGTFTDARFDLLSQLSRIEAVLEWRQDDECKVSPSL